MPQALALRATTGRFAYFNCFQEALLPMLVDPLGDPPLAFDRLRFIGLSETATALRSGTEPGMFGGVPWPELAELYAIKFTWAVSAPASAEELPGGGMRPVIVVVDRYHVPTDRLCYRRVHRTHTLLLVGADQAGVYYSDAEYPLAPAHLSFADLQAALVPGNHGGPFLATVDAWTQPDLVAIEDRRVLARKDAERDLSDVDGPRVLRQVVAETLEVALACPDPLQRELLGGDVAAFLNAPAESYLVMSAAAATGDADPDPWRHRGEMLRLAHRLAVMASQSGAKRYLGRVDAALATLGEGDD